MANTIKIKRGSGSDPAASDMVLGEPVLRTDTAELFFKKDDGSVAKVSGGGGGPDFKYLALRNAANNGAASYPNADFTLVTSGTTTAITPAAANTLLVSVNGVIQKPNTGTSTPSQGFALSGSTIKFGANISAAPDFILYQESGGIGEPSDETVSEAKLKVSNSPVNGYFLSAQSGNTGGLTWAAPVATSCTGNSATATALATARTINGTSFDGTANITVTAAAGTLTGNTLNSSVTASSLTSLGDLSGLTVTGDVVIADSIIHSGDTDTKIRFPTANQISFETQGSEAVRIEENGKVGIGSNNPSELLTVKGDAPIIRIEENQSGGSKRLDLGVTNSGSIGFIGANQSASKLAFQTVGTERMRIDSSGNVGINTTSPSKRLHVKETEDVDILLESGRTSATDNIGALQFKGGSTDAALIQVLVDGSIKFRNTNALHERMRIDDQGRVGIGTTSPSSLLHLSATNPVFQLTGTSAGNCVLQTDGADLTLNVDSGNSKSSSALAFRVDNSEKMRIDSSGRLLLGTTTEGYSPDAETLTIAESGNSGMTIRSGTSNAGHIYFSDATSGSGEYVGQIGYHHNTNHLWFGTNATERLRIDSSGRVGIGVTSFHDSSTRLQLQSSGSDHTGIVITAAAASTLAYLYMGDTDDKDIGRLVYDNSTNAMQMWTNNSERLRIDSSGNVGIGTTSPTEKLTLGDGDLKFFHSNAANAHRTTFIEFGNLSNRITSEMNYGSDSSSNYTAGLKFTTKNFNGSSFETVDAFNIQANGNVGIGTTSPAALLTLNQTIPELRLTSSNNNFGMGDELGRISLHTSDGSTPGAGEVFRIKTESSSSIGADYTTRLYNRHGIGGGATEVSFGNGEGSIYFSTNTAGDPTPAVRMKVGSDGNVGIGTTSPTSTGIQSGVKTLQIDSGDGAELILGNSTSSNVSTNHIGAIAFKNIDTSTGNAPHYAGIRSNCTDTSGSMNLKFYAGSTNFEADTPHMLITSAGKLIVGSTADLFPDNIAEFVNSTVNAAVGVRSGTGVSNQDFITFKFGGGPTACGGIRRDGTTQGPEFFSNSDRRIKTNILDMDNTLDKVNQLSLKKFDFKDGSGSGIGLIAQDLISIFPSKVKKDNSDDGTGDTVPDGVNAWTIGNNFTYEILKAIQELSTKIETLETKVAALEAK